MNIVKEAIMNLSELKECLSPGYVVTVDNTGFACLRCGEAIIAVYSVLAATPERIRRAIKIYEEGCVSNLGKLEDHLLPGYTVIMDGAILHLRYMGEDVATFSTPGATLEEIKKVMKSHYMQMHQGGVQ